MHVNTETNEHVFMKFKEKKKQINQIEYDNRTQSYIFFNHLCVSSLIHVRQTHN